MKLIPLSGKKGVGKFAMVDDADFEWLSKFKWHAVLADHTVYAARGSKCGSGNWRPISMHREILGLSDRKIHGEHKDGNGLNNTRTNLRPSTCTQNLTNRRSFSGSSSKFKGVHWNIPHKKWHARICVSGNQIHIGSFADEKAAAIAYDKKARECFGEFARLNFPDEE